MTIRSQTDDLLATQESRKTTSALTRTPSIPFLGLFDEDEETNAANQVTSFPFGTFIDTALITIGAVVGFVFSGGSSVGLVIGWAASLLTVALIEYTCNRINQNNEKDNPVTSHPLLESAVGIGLILIGAMVGTVLSGSVFGLIIGSAAGLLTAALLGLAHSHGNDKEETHNAREPVEKEKEQYQRFPSLGTT
ncbi:MAG: hypothetical protein GKR77_06775 [Legionellales bacterium]|nr:hypothetical protein [Legionellales bacterium]